MRATPAAAVAGAVLLAAVVGAVGAVGSGAPDAAGGNAADATDAATSEPGSRTVEVLVNSSTGMLRFDATIRGPNGSSIARVEPGVVRDVAVVDGGTNESFARVRTAHLAAGPDGATVVLRVVFERAVDASAVSVAINEVADDDGDPIDPDAVSVRIDTSTTPTPTSTPVTEFPVPPDTPEPAPDVERTDADAEVDPDAEGVHFLGESLFADGLVSPGEEIELRKVTNRQPRVTGRRDVVRADADGDVLLETAGLGAGDYVLRRAGDADDLAAFELTSRFATFAFAEEAVENVGDDTTAILEIDTIRAGDTLVLDAERYGTPVGVRILSDVVRDPSARPIDTDDDGEADAVAIDGATGTVGFDFRGRTVGTYTVTATAPETDARATASIEVDPPRSGGVATIATEPDAVTVPANGTAELRVVARNVSRGLGSYSVVVGELVREPGGAGVGSTGGARGGVAVTDVDVVYGTGETDEVLGWPEIDAEATGRADPDAGTLHLVTVTVRGTDPGTLRFGPGIPFVFDAQGRGYDPLATDPTALTVEGNVSASPTDPDGDGAFEDVDGSGSFDVFDVQAFLENFEGSADSPARFDFDADGDVDVFDVQALLREL